MKKIYMRAGMTPQELIPASTMLNRNIMGTNIGNLLYQYSIARTLCIEGTEIEVNQYQYKMEDVDRINQECSMFIIPLADAFRDSFELELKKLTNLVNALTIPCVVIGVGLRAAFETTLEEPFPFDDTVKEFVKAVLNKSGTIGVRGEITSRYLTKLGFQEGVDHQVIGCPSMYTFGRELNIREAKITIDSPIAYNSSSLTPSHTNRFIMESAKQFQDACFIPQLEKELELLYSGKTYKNMSDESYPSMLSDPAYAQGNARFFLNAPTWFDFLGKRDLVFGSRLHGNIAGVLGGTQTLLITKDARTKELAEFHQLPRFSYSDITDNTTLFDIIEKTDFQSSTKVHAKNFDNYIQFLNKNGIDHIYRNNMDRKDAPMDAVMGLDRMLNPVLPIHVCEKDEIASRLAMASVKEYDTTDKLTKKCKKLQKEKKELSKTIQQHSKEEVHKGQKAGKMRAFFELGKRKRG